ncbi:hypothetical protein B0J15DRAFT_475393 [Fusarium solani]|uniref:Secreted protein n=1 Tax=Fusarium solani TaxID=169388 RepID=A0A9P9L7G1_FUSSL|nr:uncharacterized protein B0J15DRAFT_475393 [Fusarium solani]KAH7275597.1 hypothetical protein B0J15DRAFT_475393 [Fusarium solani]
MGGVIFDLPLLSLWTAACGGHEEGHLSVASMVHVHMIAMERTQIILGNRLEMQMRPPTKFRRVRFPEVSREWERVMPE